MYFDCLLVLFFLFFEVEDEDDNKEIYDVSIEIIEGWFEGLCIY